MPAPLVLGFNNGMILSELIYLNWKRTSESVSSILKIIDGSICSIVLIILCPLVFDGI